MKKDNQPKVSQNIPSEKTILAFLEEAGARLTKSDIASHFKIKGNDRIGMKARLREMEEKGAILKGKGKTYFVPPKLPPVSFVVVTGLDDVDGDIIARPEKWPHDAPQPTIYILPEKKLGHSLEKGDKVLAKIKPSGGNEYEAKVLKKMDVGAAAKSNDEFLALVKTRKDGAILHPTDKRQKHTYSVTKADMKKAIDGDLVLATPTNRKEARIVDILGHFDDPNVISLIAIHTHGIPHKFPQNVLEETTDMIVPDLGHREDLRNIPLVTIDGADARDFDDAVYATPDKDGGWHLMVAIADVSWYVKSGTALDSEAYVRGNSVYFPDRVVPMLPERLSNDLCSLRPHEPRACMVAHLWINNRGKLTRKKVTRALMQSHARLTYEQVERALDGHTDDTTASILPHLKNLEKAYCILAKAREERGALEMDLPERKVTIEDGKIIDIIPRERLESHKLIEEFMVLANVAVAEILEEKDAPCIYRIHDRPDASRLASARTFLNEIGFSMPSSDNVTPAAINKVLKKAASSPQSTLVSDIVLRSQSQAVYSPDNVGHFGLALDRYAHFTSPIRRYADLVVHRSLVQRLGLGQDGLDEKQTARLYETARHISETERRAVMAERDAMERYVAAYMSEHCGATFEGAITGVNHFGLFVRLNGTGAEGLIPIRTLPDDYYIHDETRHALIGRNSRRVYRLSAPITVRIIEADGLTGGMIFEVVDKGSADTLTADQFHNTKGVTAQKLPSGKRKPSNKKNRPPPRSSKKNKKSPKKR